MTPRSSKARVSARLLMLPVGALLVCMLTPRAAHAQSQEQSQTQTQTQAQTQPPTIEQCEANPNTPGCQQMAKAALAASGQQQGLANTMNVPLPVTTGPNLLAEQRLAAAQQALPEPPTDFQLMVANSVGRMLPIYGRSLFRLPPSTFAPLSNISVPDSYVIGPGDELYLQIWGQINAEIHAFVDRDGAIYIPKVGSVTVAGLHYGDLKGFLHQQVARIYRNFDLAVTLGKLRSIDIYIAGNARAPGRYTVSSLSTLVTAVFAAGGPSLVGSLRHIELKRAGKTITDFDMYDLLLSGDESKDAPLLPGDVIYIPPVGPQVAVAGSVKVPAIYELKSEQANLADALALAGGLNEVADATKITVERIDNHAVRSVAEFTYRDAASEQVKGGDIIHVPAIVPRFNNAVTLRGNVANPGRYPWHEGMKIRDLIPNKEMLLTRDYWQSENNLVNGTATDYAPMRPQPSAGTSQLQNAVPPGVRENSPANPTAPEYPLTGAAAETSNSQLQTQAGTRAGTPQSNLPNRTAAPYAPNEPRTRTNAAELRTEVKLGAPEINWDYAVIQRLDPVDLSTLLIPFSLRKAVLDQDPSSNLPLEPGDVVTIFSQKDIAVPQADQTIFVHVEGEVRNPGIYRMKHGQTLSDLLKMAGGLTSNAYLFGAQFTRESARTDQQAALDRTTAVLQQEVQQQSIAASRSNPDQAAAITAQTQAQETLVRQLEAARATGRVVLALKPTDNSAAAVPPIVVEDGDSLIIPPKSQVVGVVGSVFDQSSFVYREGATVNYYLREAGNGNGNADTKHILLVRANGSVRSGSVSEYEWWSKNIKSAVVLPGDTIVIPPKLKLGGFSRAFRDWATIAAQGAVAASIIATH